jgi:hypothetical protein
MVALLLLEDPSPRGVPTELDRRRDVFLMIGSPSLSFLRTSFSIVVARVPLAVVAVDREAERDVLVFTLSDILLTKLGLDDMSIWSSRG